MGIFRAANFTAAYDLLMAMTGFNGLDGRIQGRTLLLCAAAVSLMPSSHELIERLKPLPAIAVPLAVTFAFMMLRINTEAPVTFIYFQF